MPQDVFKRIIHIPAIAMIRYCASSYKDNLIAIELAFGFILRIQLPKNGSLLNARFNTFNNC